MRKAKKGYTYENDILVPSIFTKIYIQQFFGRAENEYEHENLRRRTGFEINWFHYIIETVFL